MTERIIQKDNLKVPVQDLEPGSITSPESFPTDGYWYVKVGNKITLKNLSVDSTLEHNAIISPEVKFDPSTDDAGVLKIDNRYSPEEIDKIVEETSIAFVNEPKFNAKAYRQKLESQPSKIKIYPQVGSTSLNYQPHSENRQFTVTLLQSCFPDHIIESA